MRTKEEITEIGRAALAEFPTPKAVHAMQALQLEVLLDIRELLQQQDERPAATHPASPPPPEVR